MTVSLLDRLVAWLSGTKTRHVEPDMPPMGEVLDFRRPSAERTLEDKARDHLEEADDLIRRAEALLAEDRRRHEEEKDEEE